MFFLSGHLRQVLHVVIDHVLCFRDEITLAVLQLTEDGTLQVMKKTWWDKGECGFDTGYRVGLKITKVFGC